MASPDGKIGELTYQAGKAPAEVRVIDPLGFPPASLSFASSGRLATSTTGKMWSGCSPT